MLSILIMLIVPGKETARSGLTDKDFYALLGQLLYPAADVLFMAK